MGKRTRASMARDRLKAAKNRIAKMSDSELAKNGMIRVAGFTRKDGTKVKSHIREMTMKEKFVSMDLNKPGSKEWLAEADKISGFVGAGTIGKLGKAAKSMFGTKNAISATDRASDMIKAGGKLKTKPTSGGAIEAAKIKNFEKQVMSAQKQVSVIRDKITAAASKGKDTKVLEKEISEMMQLASKARVKLSKVKTAAGNATPAQKELTARNAAKVKPTRADVIKAQNPNASKSSIIKAQTKSKDLAEVARLKNLTKVPTQTAVIQAQSKVMTLKSQVTKAKSAGKSHAQLSVDLKQAQSVARTMRVNRAKGLNANNIKIQKSVDRLDNHIATQERIISKMKMGPAEKAKMSKELIRMQKQRLALANKIK